MYRYHIYGYRNSKTAKLLLCMLAVMSFQTWSQPPKLGGPDGFQGIEWGASPQDAGNSPMVNGLQPVPDNGEFAPELNIRVLSTESTIAGYPAIVRYYFHENRFFQATVVFDFDHLKEFDYNYNVFISVNRYYRAIHDETVTFTADIYDLLRKKYGKKEPIFKGLDPRFIFERFNQYLAQEQWNLKYHPYEYYQRIGASAYARWDYPETRVTFSINISARDKRFDYMLSLTSLRLEEEVNDAKDQLRMQGL